MLETMTPQDFLQFRQILAPASGFQSVQFRELEFLSGRQGRLLRRGSRGSPRPSGRGCSAGWRSRRCGTPSCTCCTTTGCRSATTSRSSASVRRAAHDRSTYAEVWAVAEALLQHDELAAAWRARHVVMVERMIGTRTGTGGSSGAEYLRSRLDLRYYPLLWELRSVL